MLLLIITFSCKNETVSLKSTIYNDHNGLSDNTVRSIAIDSLNNKWFATQSGVSKFDSQNWWNYSINSGLVDTYLLSIAIDKKGNKWIGSYYGVSKFDGTNWTQYTALNYFLPLVSSIAIDKQGNKWFGTMNNGIMMFDDIHKLYYTISDGLAGNRVNSIAID